MKQQKEYPQYRNNPQMGFLGIQPLVIDNFAGGGDATGNKITKTKQVALCGNSVSPPVAQAIIEANAPDELFARNLF